MRQGEKTNFQVDDTKVLPNSKICSNPQGGRVWWNHQQGQVRLKVARYQFFVYKKMPTSSPKPGESKKRKVIGSKYGKTKSQPRVLYPAKLTRKS